MPIASNFSNFLQIYHYNITNLSFRRCRSSMLAVVCLIIVSESVANDNNKAFGRGLFQMDPAEAEKKAEIQNNYKEELRKQMEDDKLRKAKEKEAIKKEEDLREKRFYQQVKLEEEGKNGKKNVQDRGLYGLNERPQNQINIQQTKQSKQSPLKLYEHSHSQPPPKLHFENSPPKQQYSPPQAYFNVNHVQEDRQFHEASQNKLRYFRQSLDQKVQEIYKQIKSSKEVLQVDKQLQNLRRKLHTYGGAQDELNTKDSGKFQYQYSHFYKIPKKTATQPKKTQLDSKTYPKNLNYDAQSNYKKDHLSDRNNEFNLSKASKQYQSNSNRNIVSRGLNSNNEEWGLKKGKQTYLGDRQALDFQIQSMLGNISNLLDEHQQ